MMRIVIPSSGRADRVGARAARLFPTALICVGEDEADAYAAQVGRARIWTHPPEVRGIGPLRQWILDHAPEEIVLMVDDDVKRCSCLTKGLNAGFIEDPEQVRWVIEQAAQCAKDAGCSVFGFNGTGDVRKFFYGKPFLLSGPIGCVIGFVGRGVRFDETLLLRADADVCLQALLNDRIVWIDQRFGFPHDTFKGTGGNARQRSAARHEQELQYLQRKWGPAMSVRRRGEGFDLKLKVAR